MNAGHHDGGRVGNDGHEHDVLMPGFRFHPTEEELVEFYLRRKVEGKHFNVDLIAYLDLYHYDPWELPAFATIGEKEWFFYVPRDRKYRNGDRPNRVTTSGYWKATGADRMVRSEGSRPIGLKKTLVFYTGKAPKGVRTGWIMNEYRLPHRNTDRSQKAEISLCRVYKRAGVHLEGRYQLPAGTLSSSRQSSTRGRPGSAEKQILSDHPTMGNLQISLTGDPSLILTSNVENIRGAGGSISNHGIAALPVLPKLVPHGTMEPARSTMAEEDVAPLPQSKDMGYDHLLPVAWGLSNSFASCMPAATVDELNSMTSLPNSLAAVTEKLWEYWNPIQDVQINHTS